MIRRVRQVKNQTKLVVIGMVFMILLSTSIVISVFGDLEGPEIYDIAMLPLYPVVGDNISIVAYSISSYSLTHMP